MAADNVVETSIGQLTKQEQVDRLLEFGPVRAEVDETFRRALRLRDSEEPVRPPHFKYVSSFNSVVYCPARGETYEGRWDEYHGWIIRDHGLDNPQTGERSCYISGYAFGLRGAPKVRVLRLDVAESFALQDLKTLQGLGYSVMDPEHWWIVEDVGTPQGWSLRPSALSGTNPVSPKRP